MNKQREKIVVCVRPRGVGPSWWPRETTRAVNKDLHAIVDGAKGPYVGDVIRYQWNTITDGGGFTNGFDRSCAVEGDEALSEVVDAWFEAHAEDPWPWELLAVRLPL